MSYDVFGRTPEQAERDRKMFWIGIRRTSFIVLAIVLGVLWLLYF